MRPPEKTVKEEKDKEKERPKALTVKDINKEAEKEKMEKFLLMQDRELY